MTINNRIYCVSNKGAYKDYRVYGDKRDRVFFKSVEDAYRAAYNSENSDLFMIDIIDEEIYTENMKFNENVRISIDEKSSKICFENCIFKNTSIENNGSRVVFKNCVFESKDSIIKGTGFTLFENCKFHLYGSVFSELAHKKVGLNYLKGIIIINSVIRSFYIDSPIVLGNNVPMTIINTVLPSPNKTRLIWSKNDLDVPIFNYSGNTYSNLDGYEFENNGYIERSEEIGRELKSSALFAFNSWNILRGDDEYDPFDIKEEFREHENEVFYMEMDRETLVTAGEEDGIIKMFAYPKRARLNFSTSSPKGVSVRLKEYNREKMERVFAVNGENDTEETVYRFLKVTSENGMEAESLIKIEPSIIEAPKFTETPTIQIINGKAKVNYVLELSGREDVSDISWYRVDKKDRSMFEENNYLLQSNEKDCRKIAVSRNDRPCREIYLTPNDVGKHLKVYIKPKNKRSRAGAGLNITSRIIKAADIRNEGIKFNFENVVIGHHYNMENGYLTPRGTWEYGKIDNVMKSGMIPTSEMSGFYYQEEKPVTNMSVSVAIDFENTDGNGFFAEEDFGEVYIKYDHKERCGYGIRFECLSVKKKKASITLYKYDRDTAYPISESLVGEYLLPGFNIIMEVHRNRLIASIYVKNGVVNKEDSLMAEINQSSFNGTGIRFNTIIKRGYRCSLKNMNINYIE